MGLKGELSVLYVGLCDTDDSLGMVAFRSIWQSLGVSTKLLYVGPG